MIVLRSTYMGELELCMFKNAKIKVIHTIINYLVTNCALLYVF